MASATLEPQTSVACMLPSIHTAGRAWSGSRPMVSSGMSRPSALWPSDDTCATSGCCVAQDWSWAVISA